jgi:hypothetical protein
LALLNVSSIFSHSILLFYTPTFKGLMMTFIKHLAITLAVALLAACSGGDIGSLAVTPNLSISGAEATNSGLSKTNNSYDYTVASNTPIKLICNAPCTFVASSVHASFTSVSSTNRTWQATLMGTEVAGVVTITVKFPGQAVINVVVNVQPALTVKVTGLGVAASDGSYAVANNKSVTVTCNMPCTFTAAAVNSSYSTPVVTRTSWTATVTKTGAAAPMKSSGSARVLSAIVAPTSSLTVTASAKGQVVAKAVFNIAAAAAPLTAVQMTDLLKSANASELIFSSVSIYSRGSTQALDPNGVAGTYPCQNGGTITTAYTNNTKLNTYNQCNVGNEILNGSFDSTSTFVVSPYSGGTYVSSQETLTNYYAFSITPLTESALAMTSGTYAISSGSLTYTRAYSANPVFSPAAANYTVTESTTGSLNGSINGGSAFVDANQHTMSNISKVIVENVVNDVHGYSVNSLTLDSQDLNNAFNVATSTTSVNHSTTAITLGLADIRVIADGLNVTLSGTNADGTALTPSILGNNYYALGRVIELTPA